MTLGPLAWPRRLPRRQPKSARELPVTSRSTVPRGLHPAQIVLHSALMLMGASNLRFPANRDPDSESRFRPNRETGTWTPPPLPGRIGGGPGVTVTASGRGNGNQGPRPLPVGRAEFPGTSQASRLRQQARPRGPTTRHCQWQYPDRTVTEDRERSAYGRGGDWRKRGGGQAAEKRE